MEAQTKTEQRTEDWHQLRAGRFTGSEIYRLMTGGKREMTEQELEAYKLENPKGRKTTIEVPLVVKVSPKGEYTEKQDLFQLSLQYYQLNEGKWRGRNGVDEFFHLNYNIIDVESLLFQMLPGDPTFYDICQDQLDQNEGSSLRPPELKRFLRGMSIRLRKGYNVSALKCNMCGSPGNHGLDDILAHLYPIVGNECFDSPHCVLAREKKLCKHKCCLHLFDQWNNFMSCAPMHFQIANS